MSKVRIVLKPLMLTLLAVVSFWAIRHPWWPREDFVQSDMQRYSLIHMPSSGQCPAGFKVAPRVFERTGPPTQLPATTQRYDGCLNANDARPLLGGGMIDRIDPGESVIIPIPTPEDVINGR